jgi:hypothetical protein
MAATGATPSPYWNRLSSSVGLDPAVAADAAKCEGGIDSSVLVYGGTGAFSSSVGLDPAIAADAAKCEGGLASIVLLALDAKLPLPQGV